MRNWYRIVAVRVVGVLMDQRWCLGVACLLLQERWGMEGLNFKRGVV